MRYWENMRGKVTGLLDTLTQGLTPIGMAVGGLLGEFLPLPAVISGGFLMTDGSGTEDRDA
jgi:DHA3 family macrolide efflux protein-like MFS transporter